MMAQAKEGRTAGASWGVAPSAGGPGERLASDTDISPLVNPKLRPGRLGTALGKGATPGQASGPVHPETVSFSYNHIGERPGDRGEPWCWPESSRLEVAVVREVERADRGHRAARQSHRRAAGR